VSVDGPYPTIRLASRSPRRRVLLEQIGIRPEIRQVEIDEGIHPGESAEDYVRRLALAKARASAGHGDPGVLTLAADTAVVVDDEILGKPAHRTAALEMLAKLSGRSHRVLSGVAVVRGDWQAYRLSVSRVRFRPTTAPERIAYWESGEGVDKAGAYAIQGLGAIFIERLEGSYSGVMGLPLFETAALLSSAGIDLLGAGGPRRRIDLE